MRHYLMTMDEHFEAAVKGDEPRAEVAAEKASEKAAQNPAQRALAEYRGDSHSSKGAHKKTPA